ncbi:hypothetical protein [uncultured Muribaculum sp.]|uniref:fimbrial tip adhesin FimD n=1 Tax=uncultured Muribaculum sp. TaxID=1918613 RepID=UPI00272C8412|nr:hypothetical protein [uncultured Muribaculum sp.]
MTLYRFLINRFYLTLAAALLLAVAACSDDSFNGPDSDGGAGYIKIRLSSSYHGSRAGEVDKLNENLISSAVLCLSPLTSTDDMPPVLTQSFSGLTGSTEVLEVKLTDDMRNALFPGNAVTCKAYVVANLPDGPSSVTDGMSVSDIRAIAVTSDFATSNVQSSFVMDGDNTVTLLNPGTTAESVSGKIDLQRAASKITIAVNVPESITVDGQVWRSERTNMSVLITNGVQSSAVNPATHTLVTGDYYNTTTVSEDQTHRQRKLEAGTDTKFTYELTSPFYTYPNEWNPDDSESPMTYMTLMVPWKLDGEDSYRTCYYMVPVIRTGNTIGRNIHYRVKINVNILGSFTPDEPFTLDDLSYTAAEWGSVPVDVDIADYRYLVVDQNHYTMDNVESTFIPVYTSHPTTVTNVEMTYYRYNTTSQGIEKPITITTTQYENTQDKGYGDIWTCDFLNPDKVDLVNPSTGINFSHKLVIWNPYNQRNESVSLTDLRSDNTVNTNINSISYYRPSNDPAYSRYDITITIVHTDKVGKPDADNFTKTITITQYPQMYIVAKRNNGTTSNYGNVYVNNNQGSSWYDWMAVNGLGSAQNSNINMYIINVTQLNIGDNYIIGDPRVNTPNNLGYNNWARVDDMDGVSRRLQYYYPTDESTNISNFIAPKFRIASSYGVVSSLSDIEAKYRCAGYQEQNCPAGRWRVPTKSEVEYIIKLSEEDKIPTLFNPGH